MPLIITGASGGGLTGLGTPGQIPRWTAARELGDSKIVQTGTGLASEVNIPGEGTNTLALGVGVQLASNLLSGTIAIGRNITPAVGLNSGASGNDERIYIGQEFTNSKADDNKVFQRTVAIGSRIRLGPNDNGNCVVIGTDARAGVNGNFNSCVLIGDASRGNTGDNSVGVGSAVILNGDSAVAVGRLAESNTSGVALGRNARAQGSNGCVAIGRDTQVVPNEATALGSFALIAAGHTGSIALGRNCRTSAARQLSIGATVSGGNYIEDVVIGAGGDTGNDTTGSTTIRGSAIQNGSNLRGWNIRIAAGRGSGNAATAVLEFATPSILASGSGAQTDVVQMQILQSNGGAGAPNIRINNVTNAAGAGAGTIGNTPNAAGGNPAIWVPINVNGTVYGWPLWNL